MWQKTQRFLSMIKTTQYYRIADFIIAIQGEESIFTQLPNFAPFRVDETDETKMFIIRVSDESIPSNEHLQSVYTDRSDDDMPRIEIYENEQTTVFAVSQYRDTEVVCAIHCFGLCLKSAHRSKYIRICMRYSQSFYAILGCLRQLH